MDSAALCATNLSRRDTLKLGLFGAAALALPTQRLLSAKSASQIAASKLPRPYTVPFTVPQVLKPVRTNPVTRQEFYEIRQESFMADILPGFKTEVWGYNSQVPGPTIKATPGWETVVRQINNLPATHPTLGYVPWTSTHLHGMPSKPHYDGYASDKTLPGQWKNYHYPNNTTGRTLWYHDHGVHHTAENVYMGLAAQYHLTDSIELSLPLPRGRYDVPLIISDKMFAADGSLLWNDLGHSGVYGDVILVNGKPWPTMRVDKRTYRFRVLNASISRGYRLALSNGQPFQVIATDGGLMGAPQTVTEFRIGMAERYEIVIDFKNLTAGQKIQLINRGVKNSIDFDNTGKVMQFTGTGNPGSDLAYNAVPPLLNPHPPAMELTAADSVVTRKMRVERQGGEWTINGSTWEDIENSNFTMLFANPALDSVETWDVQNTSGGWFHPVHIHLVDFQIVSRNGKPPFAYEKGPKDVVYVGENETVRLLMRFGPEHGKYMIHCHNLTHEDHDMMHQFQVGTTDPDCEPITADPARSDPPPPL
jgi:spore coat protein A